MNSEPDPKESPLEQYAAAMAQQRAEWKIVSDESAGPVERVRAYARWLSAGERAKAFSAVVSQEDRIVPPAVPG